MKLTKPLKPRITKKLAKFNKIYPGNSNMKEFPDGGIAYTHLKIKTHGLINVATEFGTDGLQWEKYSFNYITMTKK